MIRREQEEDWLIIPQREHARLAAEVAGAWGNDVVPELPVAELLVGAIRHHDDGWRTWDRSPRLDPATGWPRSFTEMPMAESSRIWTESIESCRRGEHSTARALSKLDEFHQRAGTHTTLEQGLILEVVLGYRLPFSADDVLRDLTRESDIEFSAQGVSGVLGELLAAGILRRADEGHYEVDLPRAGESVLPAIWVSRHFCWLAERAIESREEQPDEVAAAREFLRQQQALQLEWEEARGEVDPEHWRVLCDGGFRFVQFFDRLSLWLCTQERTEPTTLEIPYFGAVTLVPGEEGRCGLEPFPLGRPSLALTVSVRRVPRRVYGSVEELWDVMEISPVEVLGWRLEG